MHIITTPPLQAPCCSALVTVGMFDGVHRGHRRLLLHLVEEARKRGYHATVVTFLNHPRNVLKRGEAPRCITTVAEKLSLIEKCGVDSCLLIPFTQQLSMMTPDDFLGYVGRFVEVKALLMGFNNSIGHRKSSDGKENNLPPGIEVLRGPECVVDGLAVSSSKIRSLISNAHIGEANTLLGRYFSIGGTVVHGKHIGTSIGFPTANISPDDPDKLLPCQGVYFGTLDNGFDTHRAMISIGTNPTVEREGHTTIEAHLIDCKGTITLYDMPVTLKLHHYHRPMLKFPSIEALRLQLENDKVDCRAFFKKIKTIDKQML